VILTGVLDASGTIGLAKGGVFDWIVCLYAPLYVPAAVCLEVIGQGGGRAGSVELTQALGGWVTEVAPTPTALQQFATLHSRADREVLALALDYRADHILSDDDLLCRKAQHHGLACPGTPLVVVLLKRKGEIPAVKPVLDQMRQKGFGIADLLYQQALQAAGE
jgi:predicted nucleic acid-binding protein